MWERPTEYNPHTHTHTYGCAGTFHSLYVLFFVLAGWGKGWGGCCAPRIRIVLFKRFARVRMFVRVWSADVCVPYSECVRHMDPHVRIHTYVSYLSTSYINICFTLYMVRVCCAKIKNKKHTKKIHRTRIIFGKNMPNGNTETSLSPSTDVNALCVPTRTQM